jgi:HK97 family phage portal protein
MGLFTANRLNNVTTPNPIEITATTFPFTPQNFSALGAPIDNINFTYVTRAQAMTIPSLARAHGIIAGTIATLPIEQYDANDIETPQIPQLIKQPDPSVPRANTIGALVSDLFFYGVGYLQILEVDATNRPVRARRMDPLRVTYNTNPQGTLIVSYSLDATLLPNNGVNSLIVFNSLDPDGILLRGGRTIKTAIELEAASYRMASEPVPTMILTNDGMNLDPEQKQNLMSAFRQARRDRSTAYVEGPIKLETVGFDSAQMQLVEARQYQCGNEIARLCGIPAWYVNAESTSATYSNITSTRRELLDFGLRPYVSIIEDRLSMDDITRPGFKIRFDLDDFLRGNPAEQVALAVELKNAGIITNDEARDLVDLAPSTTLGVTEVEQA